MALKKPRFLKKPKNLKSPRFRFFLFFGQILKTFLKNLGFFSSPGPKGKVWSPVIENVVSKILTQTHLTVSHAEIAE